MEESQKPQQGGEGHENRGGTQAIFLYGGSLDSKIETKKKEGKGRGKENQTRKKTDKRSGERLKQNQGGKQGGDSYPNAQGDQGGEAEGLQKAFLAGQNCTFELVLSPLLGGRREKADIRKSNGTRGW